MNSKLNSKNNRNKKIRPSRPGLRRATSKHKALKARQSGATVRDAARLAGVSTSTLYEWCKKDPQFAQQWFDTHDILLGDLEMQAFQRAIRGDRTLLMFLLKSHLPETYNPRQRQPSGQRDAVIARFLEKARQPRELEPMPEDQPSSSGPTLV